MGDVCSVEYVFRISTVPVDLLEPETASAGILERFPECLGSTAWYDELVPWRDLVGCGGVVESFLSFWQKCFGTFALLQRGTCTVYYCITLYLFFYCFLVLLVCILCAICDGDTHRHPWPS